MLAKKIFITGGCGFLGSNLAHKALEDGRELCVFDNLSRNGSISNLQWLNSTCIPFAFVSGDIRDRDAILTAIRHFRPDVIFHCAGQVTMTTSLQNPRLDFETNALGTLNLLEALRACDISPLVVYSSTNKVYGDLEMLEVDELETRYSLRGYPCGLDERLPLDFRSPYGVSKGSADQMILDAERSFGIPATVFRHSSMYGARQFSSADQGWIGWFCRQVLDQLHSPERCFTVSGNGKQVRDLLHANDMTNLYYGAADNPETVTGHAFNIGGGSQNALSILELLNYLGQKIGVNPRWQEIAPRGSDQKVFIADITKIKSRLGWVPTIGWNEGLVQMLEWTRDIDKNKNSDNLATL